MLPFYVKHVAAIVLHWEGGSCNILFMAGTLKLPYRVDLRDGRTPLLPFASTSRNYFDVTVSCIPAHISRISRSHVHLTLSQLYIAYVAACVNALTAPSVGYTECAPIVGLLTLLGLLDFPIWLAARSEVKLRSQKSSQKSSQK